MLLSAYQFDDFDRLVLHLHHFDDAAVDLDADGRLWNFLQQFQHHAIQGFRPVQRKVEAQPLVDVAQRRRAFQQALALGVPAEAVGPRRARHRGGEFAYHFLDDVVQGDQACTSPYSSTMMPSRSRFSWKYWSWVSRPVSCGMKYGVVSSARKCSAVSSSTSLSRATALRTCRMPTIWLISPS